MSIITAYSRFRTDHLEHAPAAKDRASAAMALWDASLDVQAAEENEAAGWGYDLDARERLVGAREKFRRVSGDAAPAVLTTSWLVRQTRGGAYAP